MGTERQFQVSPETITVEDILPTANFLSRLTGMDKEYSKFIGGDVALWSGLGEINGEEIRITIGHVHGETSFFLETTDRVERWEIKERSCDVVTVRQSFQAVRGTLLNPENRIRLQNTHGAKISFCRGLGDIERHGNYLCCSECYLLQLGVKRIDGIKNSANRPSEFPVRRISQINKEVSKVEGFQSVDEAITALISLRNLISSLDGIPTETGPMPFGQSFVSERYFPS